MVMSQKSFAKLIFNSYVNLCGLDFKQQKIKTTRKNTYISISHIHGTQYM